MHEPPQIVVLVGVVLLVGNTIAWKTRLPAPLVLLVLGILVGYVPGIGAVTLPPELVLQLFLPALLYWEALNISTREMRRNLRTILLSAIPLVIATAAVVAAAGSAAGLPIAVAIALGAIVAPTDATAVAPLAARLPRRIRTVLRSESLINDGTALTLLAVAVSAIGRGTGIDLGMGAMQFVYAYAGGITIGIGVAFLVRLLRRFVRGQSLLENTVSVLTPFLAFLPAEQLGVSGVISVVTCGLVLSHYGPRMVSARTRVQARGFWQLASGLINGGLFFLVGLQAKHIVDALDGALPEVLMLGLWVSALVILVRLAWIGTVPYLIRAIDRRPVQRTWRVPIRQRTVSGWAGFRGAVSLAAALSLPTATPQLAVVIAVTLIVIVVTLVVQGLTMPAVIRFARLPQDSTEREEELLAERAMRQAGEHGLEHAAEYLGTPPEVTEAVRRQYEEMHREDDGDDPIPGWSRGSEGDLRRALIAKKREAVIRLRDGGEIDDAVLQRMSDRLDIEELRLSPVAAED